MKTITVELTEESINNALEELKRFKTWIKKGTERLLKLCGERCVELANIEYGEAIYTGNGIPSVEYAVSGHSVTVTASGRQVLFIEFGTGVTNPANHPDPIASAYPHGGFGKGHGANEDGWDYPKVFGAGTGEVTESTRPGWYHTYGNPANASLWLAEQSLGDEFLQIAREAFGTYD